MSSIQKSSASGQTDEYTVEVSPEFVIWQYGHATTIRMPDRWVWVYVFATAREPRVEVRIFDPRTNEEVDYQRLPLFER